MIGASKITGRPQGALWQMGFFEQSEHDKVKCLLNKSTGNECEVERYSKNTHLWKTHLRNHHNFCPSPTPYEKFKKVERTENEDRKDLKVLIYID